FRGRGGAPRDSGSRSRARGSPPSCARRRGTCAAAEAQPGGPRPRCRRSSRAALTCSIRSRMRVWRAHDSSSGAKNRSSRPAPSTPPPPHRSPTRKSLGAGPPGCKQAPTRARADVAAQAKPRRARSPRAIPRRDPGPRDGTMTRPSPRRPLLRALADEIEIPAERAEYFPGTAANALSDDGRFMAVFNLTPRTSVSIVDVNARRSTAHVDTPGCSLVYAAGARRFLMLCANGAALSVMLDDEGGEARLERSEPFFDPQKDPV